MIQLKTLDNGIRLAVKRMEGLMSVTMGILVGTGAYVETDEEDGISHFIEHMMFKGTKKRTSFNISDDMDSIGAQMNAFTSRDLTCYYAKSTTDNAPKAFEILSDLFLNSTFPADEMKREKGVVIEEISMNEDTPDDLCSDLLNEAFFGRCGYGRNVLGTRENVSGFTKRDIKDYMAKRYTTDNIVISMAGNIDLNLAEELAVRYFAHLKPAKMEKRVIPVNLAHNSIVRQKDIEQIHIALGFPTVKRYDRLLEATQVMNSILGGGMSSRLFQTVREKLGLAYTVCSYLSVYAESGMLVVYAGVGADNYIKSRDAIAKCIDDIRKKNISKDEFNRAKEQMKSSLIFAQESTSSQMILYGKELIHSGRLYDFDDRINKINSLTTDDLFEAVEINFDSSKMAAAVVGNTDKPIKLD